MIKKEVMNLIKNNLKIKFHRIFVMIFAIIVIKNKAMITSVLEKQLI
jgi:hypothetical protein